MHGTMSLKYNKICLRIKSLVQAVCICGCIYNPFLMLLVCWSGVYVYAFVGSNKNNI